PRPARAEPSGEPLDHGRLAGPTHGQVADGDDRDTQAVDPQPAAIETVIAQGDRRAIAGGGAPQERPGPDRGRTPRLAADQAAIGPCVEPAQARASMARMIARAISSVPTAVGSSRRGFMS